MTINSRKRGTTPKLILSEASLLHKEEGKHKDPHHVPGHGTLLLGTTLKLTSFPRSGFLASSKSKLGMRFCLVLHFVYSRLYPKDKEVGRAWFQSQSSRKGEGCPEDL